MHAPCSFFGLKQCCCFGPPCYTGCALPIVSGVKNADDFVTKFSKAQGDYISKHSMKKGEFSIFALVSDSIGDALGGNAKNLG